jgi:hypothetical protein
LRKSAKVVAKESYKMRETESKSKKKGGKNVNKGGSRVEETKRE